MTVKAALLARKINLEKVSFIWSDELSKIKNFVSAEKQTGATVSVVEQLGNEPHPACKKRKLT